MKLYTYYDEFILSKKAIPVASDELIKHLKKRMMLNQEVLKLKKQNNQDQELQKRFITFDELMKEYKKNVKETANKFEKYYKSKGLLKKFLLGYILHKDEFL
ncbi:MAG: hypothetical protein ACOC10_07690, partial [Bacteroidota bacterium]